MKFELFPQRSIERQLIANLPIKDIPYTETWRIYVDLHRETAKLPEEEVQAFAYDIFTRRKIKLGVSLEVICPKRRQDWQQYCREISTVCLAQAKMAEDDTVNQVFLEGYGKIFPELATGIIMPIPSRPIRS